MSRSAVARHVRRSLILLTVALLATYVYYAFRSHDAGDGRLPIVWLPTLSLLLNGLYFLVFAPEEAAISANRYRRRKGGRALNLGVEPSERGMRWTGIAYVAMGMIMLTLWWAFERPS